MRTILAVALFVGCGAIGFYRYLWITDLYWLLDAIEASGPQSGRIIEAALSGFIGLIVGGIVAVASLPRD